MAPLRHDISYQHASCTCFAPRHATLHLRLVPTPPLVCWFPTRLPQLSYVFSSPLASLRSCRSYHIRTDLRCFEVWFSSMLPPAVRFLDPRSRRAGPKVVESDLSQYFVLVEPSFVKESSLGTHFRGQCSHVFSHPIFSGAQTCPHR